MFIQMVRTFSGKHSRYYLAGNRSLLKIISKVVIFH